MRTAAEYRVLADDLRRMASGGLGPVSCAILAGAADEFESLAAEIDAVVHAVDPADAMALRVMEIGPVAGAA